jgi:hypothetical protein
MLNDVVTMVKRLLNKKSDESSEVLAIISGQSTKL